jgi:hypothetical protein
MHTALPYVDVHAQDKAPFKISVKAVDEGAL